MEKRINKYGQEYVHYSDREIPPKTAGFAHWQGLICHPDAAHTPYLDHDTKCYHGWIRSGEWWLHCGTCRPEFV